MKGARGGNKDKMKEEKTHKTTFVHRKFSEQKCRFRNIVNFFCRAYVSIWKIMIIILFLHFLFRTFFPHVCMYSAIFMRFYTANLACLFYAGCHNFCLEQKWKVRYMDETEGESMKETAGKNRLL